MAKERLSDEYIAIAIIEHLVWIKEQNQPSCTAHHLAKIKKIPKTQRQQRITKILDLLCEQKHVRRIKTTAGTLYEITDEGYEWYKNTAKRVFELFKAFYRR